MPKFSIVIPCRNRHRLLARAIASVRRQSLGDYELIIVDDGSDPPIEVVLDADMPRLRVIRSDQRGAAAARNLGILASSGDFIAFLDSDDEFLEHKLERVAEILENDLSAVVYSQVLMDYGDGATVVKPARGMDVDERLPDYLFCEGATIATPALVVPSRLARTVLWDESLGYGDDSDFVIRLWLHGAHFRFIPEVLVRCDSAHAEPRLSLAHDADRMQQWVTAMGAHLGRSATLSYRATHLVAMRGWSSPMTSLCDLYNGIVNGSVSLATAGKNAARGFLSDALYKFCRLNLLRVKF